MEVGTRGRATDGVYHPGRLLHCRQLVETMSFNFYLLDTAGELVELLGLIPHPEGGFFLETFRSGSEPMTTRGQTDLAVAEHCLVTVSGRDHCRPDKSIQRNCLTSIYWVPTVKSPMQTLTGNQSDHVHYYQGGQAFQYYIYNPVTAVLRREILGPNVVAGHKLQVCVESGEWKCGHLVVLPMASTIFADYCIVAEAVGPGFDYHDFHWIDRAEFAAASPSDEVVALLEPFLYHATEAKDVEFDRTYDENDQNKAIASERL